MPNDEIERVLDSGDPPSGRPNCAIIDKPVADLAERDNLDILEELRRLRIRNDKPSKELQKDSLDLNPQEVDVSDVSKCPPIVLVAGDKKEIRPYHNKYDIPSKFLLPAKINKWVICILFDDRVIMDVDRGFKLYDEVTMFSQRYVEYGRSKGVSINKLASLLYVPSGPNDQRTVVSIAEDELKSELRNMVVKLNDHLVDHALIVLPDDCPPWVHGYLQYLEVTEWGSVKRPGVNLLARTSRIQYGTLMRVGMKARDRGASLFHNLWLKYNTKLGGVNVALKHTFDTHELKFLGEQSLVLSIDLTSMAATPEKLNPSWLNVAKCLEIAAAVGMWGLSSRHMAFSTQTRAQSRNNVVTDIDLLVRDILRSYKERRNDQPPSHIIIFRSVTRADDVLEVAQHEISSIKKLIASVFNEPNDTLPQLTYLRVPKRKKLSKAEGMHKNRVVHTGSQVESILSESSAEKGNDRPTISADSNQPEQDPVDSDQAFLNQRKVVKVYDEKSLDEDQVRAMVHSLSFLSPRTTSKTRPTPMDLADLANERSRHLSAAWFMDRGRQYKDDMEQLLENLNLFLTVDMGDEKYRNQLYYV